MGRFNATRLKVQLKLASTRLKHLQAKKSNLAAGARKEIANLLDKGKDESARIKVEHIIREDFLIEGLELMELYCELLLARFGLVETMKYCDEGIAEAVSTIIWAAPRLSTDVRELAQIRDQLISKYGKEFAMQAMENKNDIVNARVVHKLNVMTPDPHLVTQYLVVIARSHKVDWEPPEEPEPEALGPPPIADLLGDPTIGYPPGMGGQPNAPAPGPSVDMAFPPGGAGQWPPQQAAYPPSQYGGSTISSTTDNTVDAQGHPVPGGYPPAKGGAAPGGNPNGPNSGVSGVPGVGAGASSSGAAPPPYQADNGFPAFPDIPSGPLGGNNNNNNNNNNDGDGPGGGMPSDDLDEFDDLTKRFEALKKKK